MAPKQRFLSIVVALTTLVCAAARPAWAQASGGNPQPATEADALAIYRAKLAEQQANNEANLAAASAGYKQALTGAKQGALSDQLKMVGSAVKNWKAPRGYAGAAALDASAIQDPFAAPEPASKRAVELQAAIAGTGLVWDQARLIARVGPEAARLCGGRLQAGDYPALEDGNLLDTPARIAQFLASCGDRSRPLVVVVESGEIVVRQ
jgi:hypothetical protein